MVKTIGNVQKDAQVRAVASGTLSNGDTIIVNSDGTVSAVAGSDASAGTPSVFENASVSWCSSVYDTANDKLVVSYRDGGNSGYGTSVVGTVSGTSISFGTPVVFDSGNVNYISSAYDTSSSKVVLGYSQTWNSQQGVGRVGNVSGTSISFGSATNFGSFTDSVSIELGVAYDASQNKTVFCYRLGGSGNRGDAVVGTVSGTSISMGTPVTYNSGATGGSSAIYDSNAQKIVIFYQDASNSAYGTAKVGTVSGTSISFGTAVIFSSSGTGYRYRSTFDSSSNKVVNVFQDSSSTPTYAVVGDVSGTSISFGSEVAIQTTEADQFSSTFDSSNNKVVIAYRDRNDLNKGKVITGSVSGTAISFESPSEFSSVDSPHIGITFDVDNSKTLIAYRDDTNGEGEAVVFTAGSTNLTSENFIGFSDGAYADTQSAVINTTCTVDRNQTSLTAGQKYYVQTDGSLGLTAADPSVEAGTAISSTEILVKG